MKAAMALVAVFLLAAGSAPSAPLPESTEALRLVRVAVGLGTSEVGFAWEGIIFQEPCEDAVLRVRPLGSRVPATPINGEGELVSVEAFAPEGGRAHATLWIPPGVEIPPDGNYAAAIAAEAFILKDSGIECLCIGGPEYCIGRLWVRGWGVARACQPTSLGCTLDSV